MSATLTQAIKRLYESVAAPPPGWPTFWSGTQPEGSALSFPNFVLEHLRERSKDEADGAGGLTRAYLLGRVRLSFFTEGVDRTAALVQAEVLSAALWAALEAGPFTVGADANVWLGERDYGWKPLRQRGPQGGYVFQADTIYTAMFQPAGGVPLLP